MINKYLYPLRLFILLCMLVAGSGIAHAGYSISVKDSSKNKSKNIAKISDTRLNKPFYFQKEKAAKVNFIAFNPALDKFGGNMPDFFAKPFISATGGDKVLNNVRVYPNPVSDLLNLTYSVSKDANITIKIMDVLGNEIATLLSAIVAAGEQTNSFNIASRLNSGLYFIRFYVGNETVIKRISVL